MKRAILCLITCLYSQAVFSQEQKLVYNPKADAQKEISEAVAEAKKERKHVLLQIGGNWCQWCLIFHNFIESDSILKKYTHENYEVVHVNFSTENKNEKLIERLEYPNRFGFPVFVILDGNGKRIHTQNSSLLVDSGKYNIGKVLGFLGGWDV